MFGDNVCSQEKAEAESIVARYAFLWEKHYASVFAQTRKSLVEARFVKDVEKSGGKRASVEVEEIEGMVKSSETSLLIHNIDGESITDVIGLYITGARVLHMTSSGDEAKATLALQYAKRARTLFKEQSGVESTWVKSKVYQYVGICYAELAMEVHEPSLRRQYRGAGVEALGAAIAVGYGPDRGVLCYQYALGLAEYGEIDQAVSWAKNALEAGGDGSLAHVWNLLGLCLGSRGDWKRAGLFCERGYGECVAGLVKGVGAGVVFSWDMVGSLEKEELINLKLSQVWMELENTADVAGALESFVKIFVLFRKFFGNLVPENPISMSPTTTPNLNRGGSFWE